jgi:transcriptional regulator with XRE-family HTH domain
MAKALQELLAKARRVKGVTLRDVEKATKISNAYLSQLESGSASVTDPSPRKLYSLATYYGLDYAEVMEAAGYIVPTEGAATHRNGLMFMGEPLTDHEAAAVGAFLKSYREAMPKKDR